MQTGNDCGLFVNFYAELCLHDDFEKIGRFNIDRNTTNNLRLLQNLSLLNNEIVKRWQFARKAKNPSKTIISPDETSTPDPELIKSARKRKKDVPLTGSAEFRKKQMKKIFHSKNQ